MSLEKAYTIETQLSKYFDQLVRQRSSEFHKVNPFRFHVDVIDHIYANAKVSVTAIATLLYEYNEEIMEPLVMNEILANITRSKEFLIDDVPVTFEFYAATVPNKFLEYRDPKGRSPAEVALIAVTVLLSILLVTTSSVLLYISGGWTIFKRAVINCLFEEVDDESDNFPMQRKTTYTKSDEDDEEEYDEESNITSVPPSSASGILGVRGPSGLGAHSMEDDEESSMTYGDRSPQGIGITKGRFAASSPKGDQGFSNMMMQRFGRTPGKME